MTGVNVLHENGLSKEEITNKGLTEQKKRKKCSKIFQKKTKAE